MFHILFASSPSKNSSLSISHHQHPIPPTSTWTETHWLFQHRPCPPSPTDHYRTKYFLPRKRFGRTCRKLLSNGISEMAFQLSLPVTWKTYGTLRGHNIANSSTTTYHTTTSLNLPSFFQGPSSTMKTNGQLLYASTAPSCTLSASWTPSQMTTSSNAWRFHRTLWSRLLSSSSNADSRSNIPGPSGKDELYPMLTSFRNARSSFSPVVPLWASSQLLSDQCWTALPNFFTKSCQPPSPTTWQKETSLSSSNSWNKEIFTPNQHHNFTTKTWPASSPVSTPIDLSPAGVWHYTFSAPPWTRNPMNVLGQTMGGQPTRRCCQRPHMPHSERHAEDLHQRHRTCYPCLSGDDPVLYRHCSVPANSRFTHGFSPQSCFVPHGGRLVRRSLVSYLWIPADQHGQPPDYFAMWTIACACPTRTGLMTPPSNSSCIRISTATLSSWRRNRTRSFLASSWNSTRSRWDTRHPEILIKWWHHFPHHRWTFNFQASSLVCSWWPNAHTHPLNNFGVLPHCTVCTDKPVFLTKIGLLPLDLFRSTCTQISFGKRILACPLVNVVLFSFLPSSSFCPSPPSPLMSFCIGTSNSIRFTGLQHLLAIFAILNFLLVRFDSGWETIWLPRLLLRWNGNYHHVWTMAPSELSSTMYIMHTYFSIALFRAFLLQWSPILYRHPLLDTVH